MNLLKFAAAAALLFFSPGPARAQQPPADNPATAPRAGYRAIDLAFDSDHVFYLSPGAIVDALAVYEKGADADGKGGETVAGTMIKRAKVLSVGQSVETLGKTIVRLEGNPNEVQYLEAASHAGNIWLTLRKTGDVNDHPLEYSSWAKELKAGVRAFPAPLSPASRAEGCGPAPAGGVFAAAAVIAGAQGRMRENYPAVSVPIAADKVSAVRAGDRIDILATIDAAGPGTGKKHKRTITLLQNILVLDIARSVCRPARSILLLAMNYKQVQQAALAWDTSEIQVAARNPADTETHVMESAALTHWK